MAKCSAVSQFTRYLADEKITKRLAKVNYAVVDVYRREDPSFIQGLYWDAEKRMLLESTGLYGQSKTQWLTIDDAQKTVRPQFTVDYPERFFGEGLSYLNATHWIELTWMERTVRLLDRDTLSETG